MRQSPFPSPSPQKLTKQKLKNNVILRFIKGGMLSRTNKVTVLPYSSLLNPILEYCVQFRASPFSRDAG